MRGALEQEARDVVARPHGEGIVRLGLPEDFAAYRLTELLSDFARSRPGLRLDVRCGLSVQARRAIERGELDLALYKRDAGESGGIAAWPERLHWVTSCKHPSDFHRDPLPLVMNEPGCLYRNRMIHAAEAAGRAWRMAYTSPSLSGIQAAVSAGIGVSILPEVAVLEGHCVLKTEDGFPAITGTDDQEISRSFRSLAELLADFCSSAVSRGAAQGA